MNCQASSLGRSALMVFLGVALGLGQPNRRAAKEPMFRISGIVVRHDTNQPLRRVHVTIEANGRPDKQASVVTGEDGKFTFTDVPRGKFTLIAETHGRVRTYQEDEGYSTGIVAGPGLDTEHIVFTLPPPTGLTIKVSDEEGDPVQGAQVWVFRKKTVSGWSRTELSSQMNTDSEGVSSLAHLEPGTYYIAAGGRPWYAQQPSMPGGPGAQDRSPSELDVAYAITYYGGSQNPDAAAPIELAEGGRPEVQITLHPVPAVHISIEGNSEHTVVNQQPFIPSVQAIGPGGIPLALALSSYSGSESVTEISGVAPGNYIVSLSNLNAGPNGRGPTPVGVLAVRASADVKVDAPDFVRTAVSGQITFEGGERPKFLEVQLVSPVNGQGGFCEAEHDGAFDCMGSRPGSIAPGQYEVRLANTNEFYIKSMAVKGGSLASGLLEVKDGSSVHLAIVAARGVMELSGIALKDGRPTSGAMVLLIPHNSGGALEIPRDQSDGDGTFTLQNVHPGHYLILAIDNGHDLEYHNAKALQPYLSQAQAIEISPTLDKPVQVNVQPRR